MLEKYKEELNKFGKGDFKKGLIGLLVDLTNHSDGIYDNFGIRYETVMKEKDWKSYIAHPERKPYTTRIKSLRGKKYERVFEYIIKLLEEVFWYYKGLKPTKFKRELKNAINTLIESAINTKHIENIMREKDLYVGRSVRHRDRGIIEPTISMKNRYDYAIDIYAKNTGKNPIKLKEKILKVCQNNYLKLQELIQTCDIDAELREDINEIHKVIAMDYTIAFKEMRRAWEIWKTFRKIGINLDKYLELNGLINFPLLKSRLMKFIKNNEYNEEILNHMKDELPKSYREYNKNKEIFYLDLYIENAKRKKYPKRLRTEREVQKMIRQVEKEVYKYFPIAKVLSPRDIILNPVHPAATNRAFNSSIKNKDKNLINTIVMTPRTSNRDEYLPTFAHEITHAVHRKVLSLGEKSKVLKQGAMESVSASVMEEFSLLVESQFDNGKKVSYKKRYKGKEFSNFWSAVGYRYLATYSLIQLGIRQEFDNLINNGYEGELTNEMIFDIKHKYDLILKQLEVTGININSDNINSFDFFDACNPNDGIIYMKKYVVQEKDTNGTKSNSKKTIRIPEAFEKRWGKHWIEKEDARIMLHWLLLETGRNENTESYYNFILDKDINECIQELNTIGLNREDIIK